MCHGDTCYKHACMHIHRAELTEVELILVAVSNSQTSWESVQGKLNEKHIPSLSNYCQCALEQASCTWQPLGAVIVTYLK